MKTSEDVKEIASALVRTQAALKPAHKTSENPHFKSRYSDLTAVWDACRGPLTDNDLTVWQDCTSDPATSTASVVTRLVHGKSGQWVEHGPIVIPLQKNDAQGIGSAFSYGKRYGLGAAVGIVSEVDDDGNEASKKPEAKAAPAKLSSTVSPKKAGTITEEQRQMIISTMKDEGHSKQTVLAIIKELFGVESTADVPADGFDKLIIKLKGGDPEGEK